MICVESSRSEARRSRSFPRNAAPGERTQQLSKRPQGSILFWPWEPLAYKAVQSKLKLEQATNSWRSRSTSPGLRSMSRDDQTLTHRKRQTQNWLEWGGCHWLRSLVVIEWNVFIFRRELRVRRHIPHAPFYGILYVPINVELAFHFRTHRITILNDIVMYHITCVLLIHIIIGKQKCKQSSLKHSITHKIEVGEGENFQDLRITHYIQ